jgi:O-antigen ligase
MTIKINSTILCAVVALSVAISTKPLGKIYPALLNELVCAIVWMMVCVFILIKKRDLKGVVAAVSVPLCAFGLMVILLVAQSLIGHSTSYLGVVIREVISLVMAATVLCVGASMGLKRKNAQQLDDQHLQLASKIIVGVALVQAAFGWLQYLELHLQLGFVSLLNVSGRVFGNIRQFNLYALLMLLGLVGCAYLISQQTRQIERELGSLQSNRTTAKLHNAAILAISIVICGALAASASRFGMVGAVLLAAIGVLDIKSNRKRALFLCAIPLVYGVFYLTFAWLDTQDILPFYGTQRALSYKAVSAESNQDRLEIWRSSIELIRQYPWFGVGFSMLAIRSGLETSIGRLDSYLDYAHNLPLQWALDYGLPAMFVLISLLVWSLWKLRRMLQTSNGRLFAVFICLPLLHEMVEFPLHYLLFLLPWCFALGYGLASYSVSLHASENTADNKNFIVQKNTVTNWVLAPILLLASAIFAINDAKKAQLFYDPVKQGDIESAIQTTYSTMAFQNIVDYAFVQIIPVSVDNAPTMHRLAAAASELKFDYLMASIYIRAAALDNQVCTAKSIAYRVINADIKSRKIIFDQINKWPEPVFRDIESYIQKPYVILWSKTLPKNC